MEIRFRLAYCGLALASYASAAGLEKIAHAQEILGQDPTLNYGLSAGMFLAGIGCAYAATRPERLIESLIK